MSCLLLEDCQNCGAHNLRWNIGYVESYCDKCEHYMWNCESCWKGQLTTYSVHDTEDRVCEDPKCKKANFKIWFKDVCQKYLHVGDVDCFEYFVKTRNMFFSLIERLKEEGENKIRLWSINDFSNPFTVVVPDNVMEEF